MSESHVSMNQTHVVMKQIASHWPCWRAKVKHEPCHFINSMILCVETALTLVAAYSHIEGRYDFSVDVKPFPIPTCCTFVSLWHSLFVQAVDKSPMTGAGPQAPVETDGYEDYDDGWNYDGWWNEMKKEEGYDDTSETAVKDVHDMGGYVDPEWEEVQEEEAPEVGRPTKKIRTPDGDDDGKGTEQWGDSYTEAAGSSRDTRDDWWQGGGEPWKNTWWWDHSWSHEDWRGRHHNYPNKRGKGKGSKGKQMAPWAYTKGGKSQNKGKKDAWGGAYVRGGYTAPDGTFYP